MSSERSFQWKQLKFSEILSIIIFMKENLIKVREAKVHPGGERFAFTTGQVI